MKLRAVVLVAVLVSTGGPTFGVLMAMSLDIAPSEDRATYIGMVNTVLGLISFLPILSGAIIDLVGYEPVFVVATGLVFLGYLATLRLQRITIAAG